MNWRFSSLLKPGIFGALAVSASSLFSQDAPWPMPSPLPPAPDRSATTVPVPRIEWLQQVESFFQNAQQQADTIKLIFDGDSITRGWIGNGNATWSQRYAKLGAFDFAVGGDGTQHLLWRISQGQLEGLHPRLVFLLIGTNNTRTSTPEQVLEGVRAVVTEYKRACPEAVIILQGIFPRGQEPSDPLRETIRSINHSLASLADGKKVIFRDIGSVFLSADGSISPEIMPDFLHLSPEGFVVWADAIQPIIDEYFPENSR